MEPAGRARPFYGCSVSLFNHPGVLADGGPTALFGRAKKIRAVVVEDHVALRELTKEVLTGTKRFEVVGEAANGDEAIKVCQSTQPDLVLLDLKMPVRDGFDTLPDLRKCCPQAKVVAYSMLQREANEARVRELGAALFIEKSIESQELVERLLALFAGTDGASSGGAPPGKKNFLPLDEWFSWLVPGPTHGFG